MYISKLKALKIARLDIISMFSSCGQDWFQIAHTQKIKIIPNHNHLDYNNIMTMYEQHQARLYQRKTPFFFLSNWLSLIYIPIILYKEFLVTKW